MSKPLEVSNIEEVRNRLPIYNIDENAQKFLRTLLPLVSANAANITRDYCLSAAKRYPAFKEQFEGNSEPLSRAEGQHFPELFKAEFSDAFVASSRQASTAEIAANLGTRVRLSVAHRLIAPLFEYIAQSNRFSPKRAVKQCEHVVNLLLFDIVSAIAVDQREAKASAALRQKAMSEAVNQFSTIMTELGNVLKDEALQLDSASRDVKGAVSRAELDINQVDTASQDVQQRTHSTSSSAEDLSSAIAEIAVHSDRSLAITQKAATETQTMNASINSLVDSTKKIGGIVALIANIANQTNLLALNATIEAARAGAAGKGFAVVATEVKQLASQTSDAIDDISKQIEGIQKATQACASQISLVTEAVGTITESARTIASACNRQSETTEAIASDAHLALESANKAADCTQLVIEAVRQTGNAVGAVSGAAGKLNQSSEALSHEVENFLKKIAAA